MTKYSNKQPFFSIIVPIFNSEKYIDNTIGSIIKQDFDDWELILIDDGSTDDSLSVVKNITKKLENSVKIYSKSNDGLAEARNCGVNYVEGQYILFVDSDDYIDVNLLTVLHHHIIYQNFPDTLVFDYAEFLDGVNTMRMVTNFDAKLKRYGEVIWNKCFRTIFYKKNNFKFNKGIYYEDTAIVHIMMALAKTTVKVNFVGYFYRRGRFGSITSSKLTDNVVNRITALNKFESNIKIYTNNLTIPKKKLKRMNYFLSLSWLYLFFDYQNITNKGSIYNIIVKKLKSFRIRSGFFKSAELRDIIIYVLVIVSLDLRMNFIIKKISQLRSLR